MTQPTGSFGGNPGDSAEAGSSPMFPVAHPILFFLPVLQAGLGPATSHTSDRGGHPHPLIPSPHSAPLAPFARCVNLGQPKVLSSPLLQRPVPHHHTDPLDGAGSMVPTLHSHVELLGQPRTATLLGAQQGAKQVTGEG